MSGGFRALLVVLLLGAGEMRAQEIGEEEDARPDELARYPRKTVERPLTLPNDTFGVFGTAGFGQITHNDSVVALGAGADYGINDDLQVSILLVRLALSPAPGSGLSNPLGALTFRLLHGDFELGARVTATIPLNEGFETSVAVPFFFRLPPIFRLDLAPGVGMRSAEKWVFAAAVPAALTIQIIEPLAIAAVGEVGLGDLRRKDTLLAVGGRVSYTFGKHGRAIVDLSLQVLAPAIALAGERPPEPSLARFASGTLELRWFSVDDYEGPDWSEDL